MRRQINLYDPALLKKRDWFALGYVASCGLLLLAVVAVAGLVARGELPMLETQAAANETQLKALREQVAALGQQIARKPDPALEREVEAARLLLSARGEVVSLLKRDMGPDTPSYAEFLRGFARQSVPGLWLTGFVFEATGGMEIRGRLLDPALLPQYILRLNREQAFQGRAFSALSLGEGKPAAVGQKVPYLEFRLIPHQAPAAGDKTAALNQGPADGGRG